LRDEGDFFLKKGHTTPAKLMQGFLPLHPCAGQSGSPGTGSGAEPNATVHLGRSYSAMRGKL
jgi:hypothetical protein